MTFAEFIQTVAKFVFIGLAILCIYAAITVKSDDTFRDVDPTHFPPIF